MVQQEIQPTGGACQRCGHPLTQEFLQFLHEHPRKWHPCPSECGMMQRTIAGEWEEMPREWIRNARR